MFRTLYRRLLVVILAFGIAMTAVFATVLFVSHEAYHSEADQIANRRLAQHYANARLLITDEPLSADNFHKGIRQLADLNPDVDLYLLDADGLLVASSVPTAQWARTRVNVTPIAAFLGNTAPLPILGDNPRFIDSKEIFSAAPVTILDCPARYLYVILRRNRTDDTVLKLRRTYTINESLGLLVSCSVLAILATLVLVRSITRRLSTLKADMERFQAATIADDTGTTMPANSKGDEIERLTALFENLSSHVQSQMESLRDTDNMRRNMVANISHDLRTPLTTLQAHLDTLALKDIDLSPDERDQYLATAINQSRRLTRLVNQLLELAKLDAGQVAPQREPFQLAELLQDIAQELSLICSAKEVLLRAEYSSTLPRVVGDIGLIERAIDNLVENSIRHTPAGGKVTLRATVQSPDRIRVDVEDSGAGILPDEQANIFDRFYRGDPSRSSDSAHTGLGLAIVKSILDLHGVTITVYSRPGLGTRFSFDLPIHAPDTAASA
jgi:signal transduction histidine kinase